MRKQDNELHSKNNNKNKLKMFPKSPDRKQILTSLSRLQLPFI